MRDCYFTFRSVTSAQRGERVLQKQGIRCTMLRTPKWMERRGCGYSLRLDSEAAGEAAAVLRENRVYGEKVYIQRPDGDWEEWNP